MSKNTFFNTRFWQDSYVADLDPTEKLVFVYCITCPALSLTGIYEIALKYIAVETGIDKEMVVKVLKRFSEDGKILYKDGWLCVVNYPKYQSFKGKKLDVAINREINAVPKDILDFFVANGYPIDTLSILPLDMDMEREQEMETPTATKRQPNGNQTPFHSQLKYLTNVPDEDIREFTTRFEATARQVKSKAEDLKNWCDMNGKRKKNYKLFLLNALKKDFDERPEEEKQKPKQRVKKDKDGNPVIVNGVIQMETI